MDTDHRAGRDRQGQRRTPPPNSRHRHHGPEDAGGYVVECQSIGKWASVARLSPWAEARSRLPRIRPWESSALSITGRRRLTFHCRIARLGRSRALDWSSSPVPLPIGFLLFGLETVNQRVEGPTGVIQQFLSDRVQFVKNGVFHHRHRLRQGIRQAYKSVAARTRVHRANGKCGEVHERWQCVCSSASTGILFPRRRLRQREVHQQPPSAASWMQTRSLGPSSGRRCQLGPLVVRQAVSDDPPQPMDPLRTPRRSQVAMSQARIWGVRVPTTAEPDVEVLRPGCRNWATRKHG